MDNNSRKAQYEAALSAKWQEIADLLPEGTRLTNDAGFLERETDLKRRIRVDTADGQGEVLGSIELTSSYSGYYGNPYRIPAQYRLESPRIPNRSRWNDWGHRTYKKIESLGKGMAQFIEAKSEDEVKLERVKNHLRHTEGKVARIKAAYDLDKYKLQRTIEALARNPGDPDALESLDAHITRERKRQAVVRRIAKWHLDPLRERQWALEKRIENARTS